MKRLAPLLPINQNATCSLQPHQLCKSQNKGLALGLFSWLMALLPHGDGGWVGDSGHQDPGHLFLASGYLGARQPEPLANLTFAPPILINFALYANRLADL